MNFFEVCNKKITFFQFFFAVQWAGYRQVDYLRQIHSKLWCNEKPLETHPSVAAFLKNGPGAYLRSALEKDSVWKRREHYSLLDKPQGIEDMVSIFLTPSNGTLVMLHAGTRGSAFSPAMVRLAGEFALVANTLLIARGGFAHRPQTAARATLTTREVEILDWVENGKRNSEIASILGLSHHTIRKHLENIFAKLGVETRTTAVAATRPATAGDQPARPGSNPIRQKNQKPA